MGDCCSKEKAPDEPVYFPSPAPPAAEDALHIRIPKVVDPKLVDQLIIEMLTVAASRVDT